jgi:hypothetical protein
MASELNELQNATVGMTVGVIEVRFEGTRDGCHHATLTWLRCLDADT